MNPYLGMLLFMVRSSFSVVLWEGGALIDPFSIVPNLSFRTENWLYIISLLSSGFIIILWLIKYSSFYSSRYDLKKSNILFITFIM